MLNVGSDGMGRWSYGFMKPLLARTFPHATITYDDSKAPDLVIRSHFKNHERAAPYSCPYITWSGESYPVTLKPDYAPIVEINTADVGRENSVWMPHLVAEIPQTVRPDPNPVKRMCCAFAFSNPVAPREALFRRMRAQEPTCYAFGRSCNTPDNPFELSHANRGNNGKAFSEFAFNVAMENKVAPGYLTEKIGFAFASGSVPIYWGDSATAGDLFNPAAFIDVGAFSGPAAAADHAIQVWRDPQKLQRYLDAPMVLNDRLADYEAVYTDYRPWQKPFVDRLREAFPDL